MKYNFYLLVLIICINTACDDNSPMNPGNENSGAIVFIVNEGNFGQGNGALSAYNLEDNTVTNNVFQSTNNRSLGDTPNSITIFGNKGYIVVNNSHTIEVIDLETNQSEMTISAGAGKSPRYIRFMNSSKAYVSNLHDASVSVINPSTGAITISSIEVGMNPDGIAIANDKVYIANSGFGSGNTVSVISTSTDQILKTIQVGNNPGVVTMNTDGEIYVVCSGTWGANEGKIFVINSSTDTVVDSIEVGGFPGDLYIASSGTGYLVGDSGIISFNTTTNEIVNNPLIAGTFYTVSVDEINNEVYVSDAKDFQVPGEIIVYNLNGEEQRRFTAGIIPGYILFYQP